MKPAMAILSVMVALSLAFSIAAFAIVANNSGLFAPNNPSASPTPAPTSPPTTPEPSIKTTPTATPNPTQIQQSTQLSINYNETTRQNITRETTQVTLNVQATYQSGDAATIPYSQLYLRLTTARLGFTLNQGYSYPQNTGSFTLSPSHTTESFQLTFEYPTESFNGMDNAPTLYSLCYNGTAQVTWENNRWY